MHIWSLRESRDLAIVHGKKLWVTELIALQGFTCCSSVGKLILDVFTDPLDFLVLPIEDLYWEIQGHSSPPWQCHPACCMVWLSL